ncbi:hypothetical protein [Erythrobacter sp.]|uniref:hypothetical protein n=1 Tax=Erythrobacter sp. TaxID=1042 RepID=UPI0025E6B8CA|nr:hypothetical protein [Erythrobacter sp.]
MSGFYAAFNVEGDPNEIQRFKRMVFRSFDEDKKRYGPFIDGDQCAIIDFTAICPRLTIKREALERRYPGAYSPDYLGYHVDHADYEPEHFWFQFTIDGEIPVKLFEDIAAEFPTLLFSGSAYDEPGGREFSGTFNGDEPWGPAKLEWLSFEP